MPSLSFIVPVFNTGRYLQACIDSIRQACPRDLHYDLILVNDQSSDPVTISLLTQLATASDTTVIHQPHNAGPAAARNQGVVQSQSEWLIFVDSDDSLPENSVQLRLDCLNRHPEANWIVGDYLEFRTPGVATAPGYYPQVKQQGTRLAEKLYRIDHATRYLTSWGTPPSLAATMIRRASLAQARPFTDTLRYGEDWYFSLLTGLRCPLFWVDDAVVHVRRDHQSMMSNELAIAQEISKASRLAYETPSLKPYRKQLAWRIASDERWSSQSFLKVNRAAQACVAAAKAIRWSPTDARSYRQLLTSLRAWVGPGPSTDPKSLS